MKVTFKDIILKLQEFIGDHQQINDFGWGNISNITTSDHTFPMIWLNPVPSNIDGYMTTLSFEIYSLDILEQDRTNLLDVMNNTLIYGNDVIANFWEDNDDLDFELDETTVTMTPFEGKFDDLTGGWIYTVDITFNTDLNSCKIPLA